MIYINFLRNIGCKGVGFRSRQGFENMDIKK